MSQGGEPSPSTAATVKPVILFVLLSFHLPQVTELLLPTSLVPGPAQVLLSCWARWRHHALQNHCTCPSPGPSALEQSHSCPLYDAPWTWAADGRGFILKVVLKSEDPDQQQQQQHLELVRKANNLSRKLGMLCVLTSPRGC